MLTALVVLALSQARPPEVLDVTAFKAQLQVLTDGKGHYVAFDTAFPRDHVFHSSDGKTFVKVRTSGGSRNGNVAWSISLWDPRMWSGDGAVAAIEMKDPQAEQRDAGAADTRTFVITCGKKSASVKLVPDAEAKALLGAATFTGPVWTRLPEKLVRDDSGTYYLVDRYRSDDLGDRRDFRVFAGPKGNMKQLPLKDIVDDEKGMILATRTGNLRLVTGVEGKSDSKWIQGKQSTALIEIDLGRYDTMHLVYLELGPYTGQRLGTPCDDFM